AAGRTYAYDARNRLASVVQGGAQTHAFGYDADGVLRARTDVGATRRYVDPAYEVAPDGSATTYYRFASRLVGWANDTSGLRFTLVDHLGSVVAEANAAGQESGQRRYLPYGGSRFGTGTSPLDRLFTEQLRVDDGGGNQDLELYHYGARAYLPG